MARAEFAQAVGAGQGKQILLVCDGAGWHVSPQVQVPAGMHVHLLPRIRRSYNQPSGYGLDQ